MTNSLRQYGIYNTFGLARLTLNPFGRLAIPIPGTDNTVPIHGFGPQSTAELLDRLAAVDPHHPLLAMRAAKPESSSLAALARERISTIGYKLRQPLLYHSLEIHAIAVRHEKRTSRTIVDVWLMSTARSLAVQFITHNPDSDQLPNFNLLLSYLDFTTIPELAKLYFANDRKVSQATIQSMINTALDTIAPIFADPANVTPINTDKLKIEFEKLKARFLLRRQARDQ